MHAIKIPITNGCAAMTRRMASSMANPGVTSTQPSLMIRTVLRDSAPSDAAPADIKSRAPMRNQGQTQGTMCKPQRSQGTEIVEIWSRLIEQLAGNVILFGMSKGIGAQDTNPTRQPNFICWCKVWMHKHKACHPKGTIEQKQDENENVALRGLCLVHLFPHSYQTVSHSQQVVQ